MADIRGAEIKAGTRGGGSKIVGNRHRYGSADLGPFLEILAFLEELAS